MLKIGDFSRLSQISIKALRHYDDLGLIQPEHTDKFTGYRYYTLKQLPRAHRIMALKEMGMSLEQIGIMLNTEMSLEELRGMFRLKQAEIEQRVRDDQKRLAMVEFHLNMIQSEDNMPELDVIVKEIEAFHALYMSVRVTGDQIEQIGDEIYKAYKNKDFVPASYPIGIFYGDEVNPDDYEFAFAIPVHQEAEDFVLPTKGTLKVQELPSVTAVTMLLNGYSNKQLIEKKVLVQRWAIENGYTLCNEMRSVQYEPPHITPPNERVTELQVVVERKSEEE